MCFPFVDLVDASDVGNGVFENLIVVPHLNHPLGDGYCIMTCINEVRFKFQLVPIVYRVDDTWKWCSNERRVRDTATDLPSRYFKRSTFICGKCNYRGWYECVRRCRGGSNECRVIRRFRHLTQVNYRRVRGRVRYSGKLARGVRRCGLRNSRRSRQG